MCDLTGPFKLCTCNNDVDENTPHWILRQNADLENIETISIKGTLIPNFTIPFLDIEKLILERLNNQNVFDFEYYPKEKDQLEINLNDEEFYLFTISNGIWTSNNEILGDIEIIKHSHKKSGFIKSGKK